MKTTLGLDIGTNSIGWALIEDNNSILDAGVRIFPVGVNEESYNKSRKEESKNSVRRTARSIRRLYDRYKLRRKQLKKMLLKLDMHPPEIMQLTSFQIYQLRRKALDEQISLKEIGRIFLLLNQRRGFKSSKKNVKGKEEEKELEGIKKQMAELEEKVILSNCRTVGEYFYSLFLKQTEIDNWRNPDEPVERIRNRFVFRKMYEREFDEIWKKQKEYYPNVLTDENYKKIKDNCIYYQRPLKSQKNLVGRCRFEPYKRVAPKSSFDFQEFRIWQTISNLRITGGSRYKEKLTIEEKQLLAKHLQIKKEMSKTDIKKVLDVSRTYTFQSDMPEKIKGNITNSKLTEALGEEYFNNLSCDQKYRLWHTLYFANSEEWLENYALEKLGLTIEQAKKYKDIDFEPDYCSISDKAIKKILPFMKQGQDYSEACASAGYHHSFDEEKDSMGRELEDKINNDPKESNLRNPLVQQSVSETIRLVNEIIKEYGKPDTIKVEFARQLKMPKDKREKIKNANDEKRRRRDEYAVFLKNRFNLSSVTRADIIKFELWLELEFAENELLKINSKIDLKEFKKFAQSVKTSDKIKYALWLECGRISPYTGAVIPLTKLFTPEIEIEHIIPYSRCMNDSFGNKTLCERDFNTNLKKNKTPYEYFINKPAEWQAFKERIKNFSEGKQAKFTMQTIPDDFLSQQLNNTAYIAKEVRRKLKTVCRNVIITNGQATSHLRRFWGLNEILNPEGKNEKSRLDHRHHAIDALVIAATTVKYIQLLSIGSKFDYTGRMILKDVPQPFTGFRNLAENKISEILISYRNSKRLISTKTNKYKHSKANNKIVQKSISVRGALHEETLFGQINNPYTNEKSFVIRKIITEIEKQKQIDAIVDKKIKEIIISHIENNGGMGSIKTALEKPVFIYSKDGKKKIPIKKVRLIDNAVSLIQLRPELNPKLFAASGNNYLIALYENNGKRDYHTVTFFDAVKNAKQKLPLYPQIKNGKELLFPLMQKDLVVIYENHPDEIDWHDKKDLFKRLYRVILFDVNGIIVLGRHNLAKIDSRKDIKPDIIRCRPNTFKGIKVKISVTGKIIK